MTKPLSSTLTHGSTSHLPDFKKILSERDVITPLKAKLSEARERIEKILASLEMKGEGGRTPSVQNCIVPIEEVVEEIGVSWRAFTQVAELVSTPERNAMREEGSTLLTDFHTWLGQNSTFAAAYQYMSQQEEGLSPEERKAVADGLREFRLSGAYLEESQQEKMRDLRNKLAGLGARFSNHVITESASRDFEVLDRSKVAGLEAEMVKVAEARFQEKHAEKDSVKKEGLAFTLTDSTFINFMRQVEDSDTRKAFYDLYLTRASAGERNNTPIMEEILDYRVQKAKLLGYKTYAENSLQTRLVHDPDQVFQFLERLLSYARPQALKDKEALRLLKLEMTGEEEIFPWDLAYYTQKYREKHFALNEMEVKQYFPANHVIPAALEIIGNLFGCRFVREEPKDFSLWHDAVEVYALVDNRDTLEKDSDGGSTLGVGVGGSSTPLGHIFMDLYARPHKQGGAWMCEMTYRSAKEDAPSFPSVYLTCNFSPPNDSGLSLLSHRDIETFFHEMGHCLHHLFTKIELTPIAGINGIPLEGVEFPSQFLERWAWSEETLTRLSAHKDTGEPLPAELIERILKAKNALSGLFMTTQIEYSLIDMMLHHRFTPGSKENIHEAIRTLRKSIGIWEKYPEHVRFENQFLHIFAYSYAAGYFSYLYSNMFSADAFELFKAKGIFDPVLGRQIRETFLERGGSVPFDELYKRFRGRLAEPEALLRDYGIIPATA